MPDEVISDAKKPWIDRPRSEMPWVIRLREDVPAIYANLLPPEEKPMSDEIANELIEATGTDREAVERIFNPDELKIEGLERRVQELAEELTTVNKENAFRANRVKDLGNQIDAANERNEFLERENGHLKAEKLALEQEVKGLLKQSIADFRTFTGKEFAVARLKAEAEAIEADFVAEHTLRMEREMIALKNRQNVATGDL